jgi:hypothetical protein
MKRFGTAHVWTKSSKVHTAAPHSELNKLVRTSEEPEPHTTTSNMTRSAKSRRRRRLGKLGEANESKPSQTSSNFIANVSYKCAKGVNSFLWQSTTNKSVTVAQLATPRLVHTKAQPSLLSTNDFSLQSGKCGFANLAVLIIVAALGSCTLALLRTGSFQTNSISLVAHELFIAIATCELPKPSNLSFEIDYSFVLVVIGLGINVLFAYSVERIALRMTVNSQRAWSRLHIANCILTVVMPCFVIWLLAVSFTKGVVLMMGSLILVMKLTSYAITHTDLRKKYVSNLAQQANNMKKKNKNKKISNQSKRKSTKSKSNKKKRPMQSKPSNNSEDTVAYPANVTLSDMCLYMTFPTLCYQVSYPRTTNIRRLWLAGSILALIIGCTMLVFVVQTFLVPIVPKVVAAMIACDVLYILELLLTMSVISISCWLSTFYLFFHLHLNIVAEVTYFADRNFYGDWWNSPDVGMFWGLWNKPVHNYLKNQVYVPLGEYLYVNVCMRVDMCVWICTYVYVCVCEYVHAIMCVWLRVCRYILIHTSTCIYTHSVPWGHEQVCRPAVRLLCVCSGA